MGPQIRMSVALNLAGKKCKTAKRCKDCPKKK